MSISLITQVIRCSRAIGPAKSVLIILAYHVNGEGGAWPSVATMVRESGFSRATVIRALASLESSGEIVRVRERGRGVIEWQLRIPDDQSRSETGQLPPPVSERDRSAPPPVSERDRSRRETGLREIQVPVSERDPIGNGTKRREDTPSMSPPDIEPSTPTPTPSSPTPSSPSPSPSPSFAMVPSPAPTPTPSSTPSKISSLKDLTLADDLRAIAEAEGVNGEREMERFRDYCLSKNRRYKDYRAAFRNWLRSPLQHPNGRPDNKRSYSPTETMRRMRERRMIHDGPASFDDPIGDRHRVHGEDADLLPPAEARQRR